MNDWRSSSDDMQDSVTTMVEEALLSGIEAIQKRPLLSASAAAAIFGGLIGLALAGFRGRQEAKKRTVLGTVHSLSNAVELEKRGKHIADELSKATRRTRRKSGSLLGAIGDMADMRSVADLAPIALQLAQNKIVRSYVQDMLSSRMKGFGR